MYCDNCGCAISETAKFCVICGKTIKSDEKIDCKQPNSCRGKYSKVHKSNSIKRLACMLLVFTFGVMTGGTLYHCLVGLSIKNVISPVDAVASDLDESSVLNDSNEKSSVTTINQKANNEQVLLYENENQNVCVYFDGFGYQYYESSDSLYFFVNVAIENGSNSEVKVRVLDTYIDGWQDDLENTIKVAAGRNTCDHFISGLDQVKISTPDELRGVNCVEFTLEIENGAYETTIPVTLNDLSSLHEQRS